MQSTLSKDLILPASFHFLLKNINHKYPIYLVALYYSIDTSQNILNKVKKDNPIKFYVAVAIYIKQRSVLINIHPLILSLALSLTCTFYFCI